MNNNSSDSSYAVGMAVNLGLVIGGTTFLVYLSTFSGQELSEKVAFYTSALGLVLGFILFVTPMTIMLPWINKEAQKSKRKFVFRFLILISVQLVLLSFLPLLVDFLDEIGGNLKAFIHQFQTGTK
jgi:dipeptide/tripeptide permease